MDFRVCTWYVLGDGFSKKSLFKCIFHTFAQTRKGQTIRLSAILIFWYSQRFKHGSYIHAKHRIIARALYNQNNIKVTQS